MPRQQLFVRTLVELADSLVDDFNAVDLLTLLSDRCVEALDVTAAGVMIADPNGRLEVIASSSEAIRVLEVFQIQAEEGPCLDCYRTGTPVFNIRLSDPDGRWPAFTARAVTAGFHSVHCLPMRLRGRTLGALNLFGTDTGPLDENDVLAGQAFADVATIAIIQDQAATDARVLTGQLTLALDSRSVIEQAKGIVAQEAGVDVDQAFVRLRDYARNHNLRLTDLCQYITDGTVTAGSLVAPPVSRSKSTAVAAPAPGWYADPTGRHLRRWWDGTWSDRVMDSAGGSWE